MRILATGVVAFLIWSFIAAWLYNDKIVPAMHNNRNAQPSVQIPIAPVDSLSLIRASMPANLPVYFEFSNSEFIPDSLNDSRIGEIKSFLEKYPASVILVKGFTDLVGEPEYNQELGLKRALMVQEYLILEGFPANRTIAESGGEDLSSDYITEEGRARARRVEISVKL